MNERMKLLDKENNTLLDKGLEIMNEVSLAHEKIRERALTHTYQLITAIGIVAGFGFTAISSVNCVILFFTGEVLLLSGMGVGMWFAKAAFIDEITYYNGWNEQVSGVLADRMKIKFDGSMSVTEIETAIKKAREKESSIFKNKTKDTSYTWLTVIFYLFISGSLLLLVSLLR